MNNIVSKGNKDNFNRYIKDISKYPTLSAKEEKKLFVKYSKTGDEKILETICNHNLLFVIKIARHYASKLSDSTILVLEDLISEGNIGLYDAAKSFDHTKDNRFLAHATWHVKKCILKLIQDNIRQIRLPVHTRKQIVDFDQEKTKLEREASREIDDFEILNKMADKNAAIMKHLVRMNKTPKSLSSMVDDQDNVTMLDVLSDDSIPLPTEIIIENQKEELISQIIDSIDKKSLDYVSDFFGLSGETPLNFSEISRKYNVSYFVVRHRITKAIERLKDQNQKRIFYY